MGRHLLGLWHADAHICRHRDGRAHYTWLARLPTHHLEELPRET